MGKPNERIVVADVHIEDAKSSITSETSAELACFLPGERVYAWFYVNWYLATVRSMNGNKVEVLWDSESSISVLPVENILRVAVRIDAVPKDDADDCPSNRTAA